MFKLDFVYNIKYINILTKSSIYWNSLKLFIKCQRIFSICKKDWKKLIPQSESDKINLKEEKFGNLSICISQCSPKNRNKLVYLLLINYLFIYLLLLFSYLLAYLFIWWDWLTRLAAKSHNLPSVSWKPKKASGVVPVPSWRPTNQGSQCSKAKDG